MQGSLFYKAKAWQELLLAAIGEQLSVSIHPDDEVCGVSVRIRYDSDVIQIWNQESDVFSEAKVSDKLYIKFGGCNNVNCQVLDKVKELVPSLEIRSTFYQCKYNIHVVARCIVCNEGLTNVSPFLNCIIPTLQLIKTRCVALSASLLAIIVVCLLHHLPCWLLTKDVTLEPLLLCSLLFQSRDFPPLTNHGTFLPPPRSLFHHQCSHLNGIKDYTPLPTNRP